MTCKIIFSTDTLARGGKERQMTILGKALLSQDYDLIFVAKRVDRASNYFSEYGLALNNIRLYRGLASFYRIISEYKPDIVVSWDIKSSLYNLLLYRFMRFRFINGSIRHGIRVLKPDQLFRSVICHLSPWVMANSHAGLKANNMKEGRRRFVLYNGVEQKFSKSLSGQDREALKESIIPGYRDRPAMIFLSVANFVPYKDYHTVFMALARIRKHSDFWYLVAGDGPMKSMIEAEITDNGLEGRVLLLGRRNDIEDLLSVSDIFIHSSRGEGISNAILEALQAGLPVVASDVGGVRETVFPATSCLFPYCDADTLEQCLWRALRRSEHEEFVSEAYKAHLDKFSLETMITGFQEIMDRILCTDGMRASSGTAPANHENL